MREEDRTKKEEQFEWWITCLPDKIEELLHHLPNSVSQRLDLSINSLDVLEDYILKTYDSEFLKSEEGKTILDGLASYIGQVIKTNVSAAKWYLELDNAKDIYFGLPVLKFDDAVSLSPYHLPLTALAKQKGNLLSQKVRQRLS